MQVIMNGEDLQGKVIKYCNIANMGDGSEHNIIATEDGSIMMLYVDYEEGIIGCYTKEGVKRAVLVYSHIKSQLLNNGIITNDDIILWEKERDSKLADRDNKIKEQKYQEYLKLKKEFGEE